MNDKLSVCLFPCASVCLSVCLGWLNLKSILCRLNPEQWVFMDEGEKERGSGRWGHIDQVRSLSSLNFDPL